MKDKLEIADNFANNPPDHIDQWIHSTWTSGEGGSGFMLTRKTRFCLDDLATPVVLQFVATPDHASVFFFDGLQLPAPLCAHWAIQGDQGRSRITANAATIEEAFTLFNDFCNYQKEY